MLYFSCSRVTYSYCTVIIQHDFVCTRVDLPFVFLYWTACTVACSVCLSFESLLNTVKDTIFGDKFGVLLFSTLGKIDEFDDS